MTARWLLAVSLLAEGCRENQEELMQLGAAEAVMQVRAFSCTHDIFMWRVSCPCLIASSLIPSICICVCACRQLSKALPGEKALLDSALGALASLAANQRKHQDRIGALGACELVVRVVEAHPGNHHFLTRCCSVVLALSELERVDEEGNHLYIWR